MRAPVLPDRMRPVLAFIGILLFAGMGIATSQFGYRRP
jgi:hypothetical protein